MQVYQEFHGICGEAGPCENLVIALFLTRPYKKGAMTRDRIIDRLKLHRYVPQTGCIPCPHYAGPVVICVTVARLKDGHTDMTEPDETRVVKRAIAWMIKNFRTPNWNASAEQTICLLCEQPF